MTGYLLQHALLPSGPARDVLVEVAAGRFSRVEPEAVAAGPVTRLRGLSVPGFANCHSHAFHRALRGHAQAERGTFWTWRERMYAEAERLDPDSYFTLACRVYAELAAAGYTGVGEFHYLHHQPGGTPYDDPNAMGLALVAAAREAGIRITLLDTCYLSAGFGDPVSGMQRRYSDGDAHAWAERFARLVEHHDPAAGVVVGAAIHSVRAVPRDQLPVVVAAAAGRPLHVHLSEQPRENADCMAAYGATPTQVLADAGALGPLTTVVHATHLTDADIADLGTTGTTACFCPTTERDLADGVGPATQLVGAGARLTIGSDSHAVIDPFEELRAVELDERLVSGVRGHWAADDLLAAGTRNGHDSLGYADAGEIAVGRRADLATLALDTPRTWGAGAGPETAVFAATAADLTSVLVDGRPVPPWTTMPAPVSAPRSEEEPWSLP